MKKILHRIFFNFNDGPDPFASYLETWKKELPDFEIMYWDKSNLPLDLNEYTRHMTVEKNHAFLSDYFRCWLLKQYGGVYLDADIEILDGNAFRKMYEEAQSATDYNLFIGIESRGNGQLTAHSMGLRCGTSHEMLDFLLQLYETAFSGPLHFWIRKFNIPSLMTLYFLQKEKTAGYALSRDGRFSGIDEVLVTDGMKIYPQPYFSPVTQRGKDKMISAFTNETCLCHHFAATWTTSAADVKVAKLFADTLKDNEYVIDPAVLSALKERSLVIPKKPRLPNWKLKEKQLDGIERFLNFCIPFGSKRYRLFRRKE